MDGVWVFLIVAGLPCAIWPYEIARFDEQTDAIGSKRSSASVEPADWKVAATRLVGVGCVLVGLFFVGRALVV